MITIQDKKFTPFIDAEKIQQRVRGIADQISLDYQDKQPLLLCVLNGAFIFIGDLAKALRVPAEFAFIRLASYKGTKSTGKVSIKMELEQEIEGRHLIVVEDIVDTGKSMNMLLEELKKRHPESIALASLLAKPDATILPVHIDYLGFEIPNKFVVGYGLDIDGYGRNLPEIYQVID
ncbi:hypoxanthine phosphoribosyltransferase [Pleomorphovibrio marinus]|uniref:hypoxanthine phosphoribosyltransferase n=1 Tax=Pleomorphovibrio marinus TaxID=2164132 RepID=UPI000E0A9CDF|nr:hypoxanthine phosphoribosyltransferase [Pleomorphovibrio marinus]